MTDQVALSVADIEVLARLAALPLPAGRPEAIREPLSVWVQDANELSRKMSRPEYWHLVPATVFQHPVV